MHAKLDKIIGGQNDLKVGVAQKGDKIMAALKDGNTTLGAKLGAKFDASTEAITPCSQHEHSYKCCEEVGPASIWKQLVSIC
jgi:hypothetical protein